MVFDVVCAFGAVVVIDVVPVFVDVMRFESRGFPLLLLDRCYWYVVVCGLLRLDCCVVDWCIVVCTLW